MALSQGTNYSYTPPKPPKPQVSYGAPSGPYAAPLASPAAVSTAHLQQTLQQPMQGPWRGMGQPELQRLGDPFAQDYAFDAYKRQLKGIKHYANPWEQRYASGFWGTFDPRNYTPSKLYEGGKFAVQHPIKTLDMMFTTPEGLGGLTSGAAITAATGGAGGSALLKSAMRKPPAAQLAEDAAVVKQATQAARASAPRGNYGIPGRQAMLDRMNAEGYTLGSALRGDPIPDSLKNATMPKGDPTLGLRFDYTGGLRNISDAKHEAFMRERMGELDNWLSQHGPEHPEFADRYNDYLDQSGLDPSTYDSGGTFEGFSSEPQHGVNIHDEYGNLVGSGTHTYEFGLGQRPLMRGGEVYIRPEYRNNPAAARALLKQALDNGPRWDLDATFAHDDLAAKALRLHDKGKIRLTPGAYRNAKFRDPQHPGVPGANGLFPYEQTPHSLPPLITGPGGILGRVFHTTPFWSGG